MTVKQVASLTGVSVRTLQFYDEIGLFKPTATSEAGYRLYDEAALETLQQILFFKELDFTLREIQAILADPAFDRAAAFAKQRQLIEMKRDRLNGLLELLDRLAKGETWLDFDKFDMSEYFRVLAEFKETHLERIVERFGSVASFDEMLDELKAHSGDIAPLVLRQYGSMERYAAAMRETFQNYLENGPSVEPSQVDELVAQGDAIAHRILSDLQADPASPEVQAAVAEWVAMGERTSGGADMGDGYWPFLAECYLTNPAYIEGTDRHFGKEGCARFLGLALKAYLAKKE